MDFRFLKLCYHVQSGLRHSHLHIINATIRI